MNDVTISTIGGLVNNTKQKTIPVIGDMLPLMDSQDKNLIKKISIGDMLTMTSEQTTGIIDSMYTATDVLNKLKTVDGTGSGLDADLLDGYHKESFFYPRDSAPVDVATITESGIYSITSSVSYTNFYTTSGVLGTLLVFQRSYASATHMFYRFIRSNGDVWECVKWSGVMGTWYQSWNTNNDGSGSLLDADLLDGQHASEFAPVVHTHTGMPVSVSAGNDATNRKYIRIASLTASATQSNVELMYSGGGDYGSSHRASYLIQLSQRSDSVRLNVFSFNDENVTDVPVFYTKKISTWKYELWVLEANYNLAKTASALNLAGGEINMDSVTTTAPSDLISVTVSQVARTDNQVRWLPLVYPVGAIYISTVSTSPATLFGFGTWTAIAGKFLIGADGTYGAGSTGGTATHNHTSAPHTHDSGTLSSAISPTSGAFLFDEVTRSFTSDKSFNASGATITSSTSSRTTAIDVFGTTTATTPANTGSAGTLPPYLSVYIWERTA